MQCLASHASCSCCLPRRTIWRNVSSLALGAAVGSSFSPFHLVAGSCGCNQPGTIRGAREWERGQQGSGARRRLWVLLPHLPRAGNRRGMLPSGAAANTEIRAHKHGPPHCCRNTLSAVILEVGTQHAPPAHETPGPTGRQVPPAAAGTRHAHVGSGAGAGQAAGRLWTIGFIKRLPISISTAINQSKTEWMCLPGRSPTKPPAPLPTGRQSHEGRAPPLAARCRQCYRAARGVTVMECSTGPQLCMQAPSRQLWQ